MGTESMALRRQSGFTLVEFLTVVIIMGLMAVLATQALPTLWDTLDRRKASASAERLIAATQTFYRMHCNTGANPSVSVSLLVNEGLLPSSDIASTAYGDLVPAIAWGSPSRIRVTLNVTGSPSAQALEGSLGADERAGNRLIWDRLPELVATQAGAQVMKNLRLEQPGACQ